MKRALQFISVLALVGVGAVSAGGSAEAGVSADDLEIILAIDTSGSMSPATDATKAAANEFVAAMPPEVRIGLLTFADTVTVLSAPTTDRTLLGVQVDSITTGGDTALYDVIVTASQHFTSAAEHRVLLLLSDGKDDGSTATLNDAVEAAQGFDVEAISLTTSETDVESLMALGPVTSADDVTGVSAAFTRVADLVVEVIEPTTVPSSTAPSSTAPTTTIARSTVTAAPSTVVGSTPTAPAEAVAPSVASASPAWLWLGGVGVFVGLFLLVLLLFPADQVSKSRLGIDKPRTASEMGTRTVSAIEDALDRSGKKAELGSALAVADISTKPAEFVAIVVVVAVIAGLVGLLLAGPIVAILVGCSVCLAVGFHVRRTKAARQAAFADQLPDVLQLIATALRSGYGITQAIESVSEEAEEPARSEFAQVLVESRMGRDLSSSMHALAQRMESDDLEWVVSAIDINRETGGNLSEILGTVTTTIRERGRLARHVRTLTAEGRLSARILIALPLGMLLWQWRVNPHNFDLLTHGVGLVALVFAGILLALGAAWVNRIVNSVAL